MNTRCAGSDVLADGPFFDFTAVCPACFQLVQVRPEGDSLRLMEHSRSLPVNEAEDRLYRREEAA